MDPLPLTMLKVEAVASMFRKGKYRSFNNYMNMAADQHLMEGFPMPKSLQRMMTKVRRAVERGQGPADQSLPLHLQAVAELGMGEQPVVQGGMVCPQQAMIMGAFFMTREIELTAANLSDIYWDLPGRRFIWLLPASKTDTSAKGVRRSWGCVCAGKPISPCPYCASLVVKAFHEQRGSSPGTPLFCTISGERVSKEHAVKTMQHFAMLLGLEVFHEGICLIGGHTLRITGAQHMASIGVEVYIIQLVGRWGGQVVLRYVQEAPLLNITEEYRNRVLDKTMHDRCRELVRAVDTPIDDKILANLKAELDTVKDKVADAAEELGMFRSMVAEDVELLKQDVDSLTAKNITYVQRADISEDIAKWHPVTVQHPAPPGEWRTECGWRFAGSRFTSTSTSTWPEPACEFCAKVLKRRKAKRSASSSTGATSSS